MMSNPKHSNNKAPDKKSPVKLSVIICTKDRCELLERTLRLLGNQELSTDSSFEIIVVDNNSSDATPQVAKQAMRSSPVPITYIVEKKVGLSRARNKGIEEAKGEILVFTDDDMIFPDNWLACIEESFARKPAPACVTGPVEIHSDSHPALRSSFPPGPMRFRYPVGPGEAGRGNNMAFSRSFLKRAGKFDTRLGAGTKSGSAEDTDMILRILKLGGDILFDPRLNAYHDHHRHDPDAIRRICRSYAIGGTAFLIKHIVRFDVFAMKLLFWRFESFRLALKRCTNSDSYSPPEKEIKKIYMRGYFAGICRGILNLFKRP